MAYATKPAGADPLAHTIYVWPSQELIARSWAWPEAWHAAYQRAASEVGREVAVHVLGGLAVREQSIELKLGVGSVNFTVRVFGTSIFVSITAFEGPDGPDSPGPDGGCEQPRSADGLILGLRGTGKSFVLVTFYGYLPPLPVGCSPGHLGPIFASKANGVGTAENGLGRKLTEQPAGEDRAVANPGVEAFVPIPRGRDGAGDAMRRDLSICSPWNGRTEVRHDQCLPSGEKALINWTAQTTGLPSSRVRRSFLH